MTLIGPRIAGFQHPLDTPLCFTFTPIQGTIQAHEVPFGLLTSPVPYGRLQGSIVLGDSQSVSVRAFSWQARGDGSCFFYGFGQGIRQAHADQQFREQLEGLPMFSAGKEGSFLARFKFLAELPMTAGAPEWRRALSEFCFGSAASFVEHCGPPLSDEDLCKVHLLSPTGAWSEDERVRLVQQRAVLLLDAHTYVDETHLIALHHFFNCMLDISFVQEVQQEDGNRTFVHAPGTKITSNIAGAAQVMMLHQEHSFSTLQVEGNFVPSQSNHFNQLSFIDLSGPGSSRRFMALPNQLMADCGPKPRMGNVPKAIQQTSIPESTMPASPSSNDSSPSCPPPPQNVVPPASVDQLLQISCSPLQQSSSLCATAQHPIVEVEQATNRPQTIPAASKSLTDTLHCKAFQIVVSIPCEAVAGWQRCQEDRHRLVEHLKKGTTNCIAVYRPGQGCTQIHAVCCFREAKNRRNFQSNLYGRYAKKWENNIPMQIRVPGDASVRVQPLTDHGLHHLCLQLATSSNPQLGTVLVHNYDASFVGLSMATPTTSVLRTSATGDQHLSLLVQA